MDALAELGGIPRAVWYTVLPFTLLAVTAAVVRAYTTWNYRRSIKYIRSIPTRPGKQTIDPPQIPYTFPGLGNTLTFLATKPGSNWEKLFSWHPRSSGALTLIVGGIRTHVLFTPSVVAAMFKDKTLKRDVFEETLCKPSLCYNPSLRHTS